MGNSNSNIGGGMSAMNVPSSFFNDGMDSQMMGGQMSRLGTHDMMNQMQMRQMELRMNQMQSHMQFEGMGSAIPFETPSSMSNRMSFSAGGGGNGGFSSQQEMMQYEQAMRNSQMSFGDRNRMVSGMPFNAMGQSDFGGMDRVGMGPGHDMMSRASMSGPGSDMMGMSRSAGTGAGLSGQDMMRGSGQDMMRTSAFERMSRGMGGQDMMGMRGGMNIGMGGQDWRGMGDQQGMNAAPGGGFNSQNGGDSELGIQERGKIGKEKEKEI